MRTNDIGYLMKRAASRAAESDYFLAKVFRAYEKLEKVSASDLAQHLGCPSETLIRAALCRRPDSDDPRRFKADIERIAGHFGIDATKLTALVRYVDAMESFSKSPQLTGALSEPGVLLTARDQEQPSETEEIEEKAEDEEKEDEENDTT